MYQGHKNWNHWNVSLWISNDEGLYNIARDLVRYHGKEGAARILADDLDETPDGAPYSYTSIRAALRDI